MAHPYYLQLYGWDKEWKYLWTNSLVVKVKNFDKNDNVKTKAHNKYCIPLQ